MFGLHGYCYRCEKEYESEENGQVMQDDGECHIWYCDTCIKSIQAKQKGIVDSCQFCKKPLQNSVKIEEEVILLHIDCYERVLERQWITT